ncbi:MAG: adenylosuccinate lyase [Anaerolineae bacterium]|nr:adenylosuccinate lyase [Anaerolineae bacterium]
MQSFTHETYLSPFTWRYGSPEMRALWSEANKRRLWRRVWVALASAQARAGLVSPEELEDIRRHQDDIDIERAESIEREIRHDLMAEIRVYAEQCPVGGGKIHLGATSMDIEDNADVLRLKQALDLIRHRLATVLHRLVACIRDQAGSVCMGFTHIQPAEPTTVGYRLSQYAQDFLTDLQALDGLLARLRGKGLKGAVGTAASYRRLLEGTGITADQLEAWVMEDLGLASYPVASQVYPRKQDLAVVEVLSGICCSAHKFAFDLRLLQSPPVGEWSEPFGRHQVGSSAMPFKRNPVSSETVCSLARYVSSLPAVLWDDAANCLLERTLDDSANRRVTLPNAFLATDHVLSLVARLVQGLVIRPEAIRRNLDIYGPFAATEVVLMEAVRAGADRQQMHEVIREHAMATWAEIQEGGPNRLGGRLAEDERLTRYLAPERVLSLMESTDHVGEAERWALGLADAVERYLDQGGRKP